MVFGNMGETSGTGVAFTRDPATGDNHFYGEYLNELAGVGEGVSGGGGEDRFAHDLLVAVFRVFAGDGYAQFVNGDAQGGHKLPDRAVGKIHQPQKEMFRLHEAVVGA